MLSPSVLQLAVDEKERRAQLRSTGNIASGRCGRFRRDRWKYIVGVSRSPSAATASCRNSSVEAEFDTFRGFSTFDLHVCSLVPTTFMYMFRLGDFVELLGVGDVL